MRYNFTEIDFEYLHDIIGVEWSGEDNIPKLNGVILTEEDLLKLLE